MDDAGPSAKTASTDPDETTGNSNLVNKNFREDDVCIVCNLVLAINRGIVLHVESTAKGEACL